MPALIYLLGIGAAAKKQQSAINSPTCVGQVVKYIKYQNQFIPMYGTEIGVENYQHVLTKLAHVRYILLC